MALPRIINSIESDTTCKSILIDKSITSLDVYFSKLDYDNLSPESMGVVLALGDVGVLNKALHCAHNDEKLSYNADMWAKVEFIKHYINLALNTVTESPIAADRAHVFQDAKFIVTFYKLNPILFPKIFDLALFKILISSIANYDNYHFAKLEPEAKSLFYEMSILIGVEKKYALNLIYYNAPASQVLVQYSFGVLDLLFQFLYDTSFEKPRVTEFSLTVQKFYLISNLPQKYEQLQSLVAAEILYKDRDKLNQLFLSADGLNFLSLLENIYSPPNSPPVTFLKWFLLFFKFKRQKEIEIIKSFCEDLREDEVVTLTTYDPNK